MFENEFYPTPQNVIGKMLKDLDLNTIGSVLEPSAGKGDIATALAERTKTVYSNRTLDIDTVEIDENLVAILKSQNIRVIHNDFLTLKTFKKYDLIIMNPPFSNGDKHLLKALDMQKNGGQIIALLNADTIRNPFSNIRQQLLRTLDERTDYSIEYLTESFSNAERSTNVDVALLRINVKEVQQPSYFKSELEKADKMQEIDQEETFQLANSDMLREIVHQYNLETELGVKLINEFKAMKPFLLRSFDEDRKNDTILYLQTNVIGNYSSENVSVNDYLKLVRYKYWSALFDNSKFTGDLTTNLLSDLRGRISEFAEYDFTLFNIYSLQLDLSKNMTASLEDTIIKLFDKLSHQFSYADYSSNVHYFNGWSTNKAWYINKKVVIPIDSPWNFLNNISFSTIIYELRDIEKVLRYFNGNKQISTDLSEALKEAEAIEQSRNIETEFFYITFYKKGTAHITFKDLELLKRFNIYAGQKKAWLPPTYGKAAYNDMSQTEKDVIDAFEGEASYNKVYSNNDNYIVDTNKILSLN
ncbi:DUF4942 domain-containing protein [Weissella muntiaci]|uniref:DUF4942 domain-containing protein n=1 Tax=Weissella muntiaci TaxID=2508881 RepID=A0A6C2CBT6_9LACO|nr:DUF4942 domain-containing protein [Weissella muntiaci]TYC51072.1 DUF4942 domain-containing protein [Weissella muntiaci]